MDNPKYKLDGIYKMSRTPFGPPRRIWEVLGCELQRRVDDDAVVVAAVEPPQVFDVFFDHATGAP